MATGVPIVWRAILSSAFASGEREGLRNLRTRRRGDVAVNAIVGRHFVRTYGRILISRCLVDVGQRREFVNAFHMPAVGPATHSQDLVGNFFVNTHGLELINVEIVPPITRSNGAINIMASVLIRPDSLRMVSNLAPITTGGYGVQRWSLPTMIDEQPRQADDQWLDEDHIRNRRGQW
jgi:hypothetical protein